MANFLHIKGIDVSIQLDRFRIDKIILQRILDFLPYPFLVAEFRNGTHTNLYANRKFVEEIGYTIEEIPTIDDWFEKAYPDEAYRDEVIKGWGLRYRIAQREKEESVVMKAVIHTRNFGDKWYEVKSSVFGRVQLIAFINIDDVVLREKELSRLNENKNKILSILSHDLRGPIANLHSLSQLSLNRNLSQEEFFLLVKNVNEKTFQALEFLDTTLLWTKANFDTISIVVEVVDLKEIVNSVLQIYEDPFHSKQLRVSHNLEDFTFISDPAIITIVIRNLISNAIKFTPEGGTISISSKRAGNKHIITVQDSGIGMTHEVIAEIFTDHYTSRKGTQQEKGLGIGLKICRELLNKISGQLDIKSLPGQGTIMSIVFADSLSEADIK